VSDRLFRMAWICSLYLVLNVLPVWPIYFLGILDSLIDRYRCCYNCYLLLLIVKAVKCVLLYSAFYRLYLYWHLCCICNWPSGC
jgi:hypothetical protein